MLKRYLSLSCPTKHHHPRGQDLESGCGGPSEQRQLQQRHSRLAQSLRGSREQWHVSVLPLEVGHAGLENKIRASRISMLKEVSTFFLLLILKIVPVEVVQGM